MIATSPLVDARADLAQLRAPIPRPPIRQRVRVAGRRVWQWRELRPLPPLLAQLRAAADRQGSLVRGPERRQRPGSRPPGSLDAIDLLARVYGELSGWHGGLALPSPPRWRHGCAHGSCRAMLLAGPWRPVCASASLAEVDWQLHALGQLDAELRRLSPPTVEAIGADVHRWWRWAASASGLGEDELRELRKVP